VRVQYRRSEGFLSLAVGYNRPVIGAFHPAGQWHSPSRSGGGRSILWERRQPVCEEVTIGPVQGFPNLLSQLGRGADVLGLPVRAAIRSANARATASAVTRETTAKPDGRWVTTQLRLPVSSVAR
jgi:hypothetical protein